MFCHNCGHQLADGAKFCTHCGTTMPRDHGQVQGRPQRQQDYTGPPKPDVQSRLMKNAHDLRILLVGRTGHGKSATGNSLLGIKREEGFLDEMSKMSVTKVYSRLTKQRFGRNLEVTDTPGILDTTADHRFVYEQIETCTAITLPGFNAIFLVLRPDRFTAELVKTVEIFFKLFGHGIDEYAFVLFTYMETEAELKKYINEDDEKDKDDGQKAFQVLKKRCQDKMLFIDNKASKDDKEDMVWNILAAVDEANAKAPRPYFQNKLTKVIAQKAKTFYDANVLCLGSKRAKEDLRILLLGLHGHGTSATGNSLLGESLFPENTPTEQNTEKMTQSGESNGRKIKIVEFPVKDTSSQSDDGLREQLLQAEKMLSPGFHAVCFVIDPNKFSEVEDHFKGIMKYFGDEASDYGFVLITFTKHEDEFDRCFRSNLEAKHPVTSVFEFCKEKELYIDNKGSTTEKEKMIKEMFHSIDSANVTKSIPYFSSRFKEKTEEAESLHDKLQQTFNKKLERQHKEAESLHDKLQQTFNEKLETQHNFYQELIAHLATKAALDAEDAKVKYQEEFLKEREAFEAYKRTVEKKSCIIQ